MLFLIPLQFVHLFCNQSKSILTFFSCILSLLLLFFWTKIILNYIQRLNPYLTVNTFLLCYKSKQINYIAKIVICCEINT
jgi:hypothetical protein